jgi:hypothetical protein
MENIFKIKSSDNGKVFIVRPLLNAKNLKENILSYKVYFNELRQEWVYRYLCFALVDDELKIFDFSKQTHYWFVDMDIEKKSSFHMLMMNSDRALKITVKTKMNFFDNEYEIINDDKYRFDNTEEKRIYISKLLKNTDLDLSAALNFTLSELSKKDIRTV